MSYTFTVLTPTYNRAHTLANVYDCLVKQTLQEFEWLIVDDGSRDHTENLVHQWMKEAPFAIRYFKKTNGGKHTALNLGIREAEGDFTVILDSDDVLKDDCLERLLHHWLAIPEEAREGFAGVTGLCVDQDNQILGGKFPRDTFDSDAIAISYVLRLSDDRYGMQRTDVMRQFPFPVFAGERFLTESVVWNRVARQYKNRYINEAVCIKEYRADGLTRSVSKHLRNNPKGSSLYYQELLDVPEPLTFKVRLGIHAYYLRYALHAKTPLPDILWQGSKHPLFMLLGGVLGLLLFLCDKVRCANTSATNKVVLEVKPTKA